ncbi:hypothetical protein ACFQS1_02310 [Paractinoplanes rhizophilus]|uniref:Uncharacterized protein n=1 Tax=Paractinoplanes rhizophilus TaxID=1416877 RepID=A0ABW2HM77_9ACTN|nr:hypothetical protein [Actinoplanes sp.]
MATRGRVLIAGAAVVLLWAGFAYDLSRPADAKQYRRTMVQVAEAAHDATRTGGLVGAQELAGNVTAAYATTAFDDATKALAGAQHKFAGEGPPDDSSAALRDRLSPLLSDAVIALGDTAQAPDDQALRDGTHRLDMIAGKLRAFVVAYAS